MKVDLTNINPALVCIINNPEQIITLDANFLIPPTRNQITNRVIGFGRFKKNWLDPIFNAFPNLAIHEAVYEELVENGPREYVDKKKEGKPPGIIIHNDYLLKEVEKNLRDTVELKIAAFTKYDPILDNKDDRGEVKSLSYIAVKDLLYFASHDNNTLQLIEKSDSWSTGLDNVQAIKMYELIYFLWKNGRASKKAMKMLYKYQYYLTHHEKATNHSWGNFASGMDDLYESHFNSHNLTED